MSFYQYTSQKFITSSCTALLGSIMTYVILPISITEVLLHRVFVFHSNLCCFFNHSVRDCFPLNHHPSWQIPWGIFPGLVLLGSIQAARRLTLHSWLSTPIKESAPYTNQPGVRVFFHLICQLSIDYCAFKKNPICANIDIFLNHSGRFITVLLI